MKTRHFGTPSRLEREEQTSRPISALPAIPVAGACVVNPEEWVRCFGLTFVAGSIHSLPVLPSQLDVVSFAVPVPLKRDPNEVLVGRGARFCRVARKASVAGPRNALLPRNQDRAPISQDLASRIRGIIVL